MPLRVVRCCRPDILTLVPLSYRTAPFPSRAIDGFLISDSSLALTCSSMHTVQRLTPGPFFHWLPLKPLLLNSLWHSAQIVVVLASMLQTVASHGGDKRASSPVTPASSIPQLFREGNFMEISSGRRPCRASSVYGCLEVSMTNAIYMGCDKEGVEAPWSRSRGVRC